MKRIVAIALLLALVCTTLIGCDFDSVLDGINTGSSLISGGEINQTSGNGAGDKTNNEGGGLFSDPEIGSTTTQTSSGNGETLYPDPELGSAITSTGSGNNGTLSPDPELEEETKPDEYNILYVSSQLKLKEDGQIDTNRLPLLQQALRASGYTINVEDMYASVEDVPKEKLSGYYLYVFESVSEPENPPTDGMIWYINTEPTSKGIEFGNTIEASSNDGFAIEEYDSEATDKISTIIKKDVSLDDIKTGDTVIKIATGAYSPITKNESGLTTIYEADDAPLIMAGECHGQRVVVFTFSLEKSSIPLAVSDFTILISNMVIFGYKSIS
ncbi:MAG: hypothetical protein IKB27_05375 [Clostridia bacterium]|nr:hypothetical protein [Clostridia bacterium]